MPFWALWMKDTGLEVLQREKWELRRDLSDVLFRVATEHDPPYASTSKIHALSLPLRFRGEDKLRLPKGYLGTNDSFSKYISLGMFYGEIWESLQYTTNFSYWMVTRVQDLKFDILMPFRSPLLMEGGELRIRMGLGMEW